MAVNFTGSLAISGSLTSTSTITATTLVVQTITSSISSITGTTNIGSINSNAHTFTGSVSISGSSTTALNVNSGTLFISASGFVGMGITGSTNPVRLSVSGTIESLTDGSGEGGQITLRGNTYQYGIDNYNGTGLRIIRENDGTGASGSIFMFVSASGFVGIGTSTPTSLLEVQANQNAQTGIRVRNSTSGTGATVEFGAYTNSGNAGFGKYSTGTNAYKNISAGSTFVYNGASGDIALLNDAATGNISFAAGASSTAQMFISASGNVGIGNTNPRSILSLPNSTGDKIDFYNDGSARYTAQINAGELRFYTTGSDIISLYAGGSLGLVNKQGNIGIGTSSPSSILTVASAQSLALVRSTTTTNYVELQLENTTNYFQIGVEGGSGNRMGGTIAYNAYLGSYNNYGMTFHTNNLNRMTISSGGTLYVGTTSNQLANATPQFSVLAGAGTDAISIKHTVDGNNTVNIWQTGGGSSHSALAFYKGDTQTLRGYITVSVSGTTYNSSSDYRLKENIVPLENGLARLMQLKPSKFNWIETGEETEGFIAHEVQEIFPYAVTGEKDAVYVNTGNIKPQAVDYGRITPLLVKAIQELKAENDSLKSRIEALENK